MKTVRQLIVSLILLSAAFILSCYDNTETICVTDWEILYTQDESLASIAQNNTWKPFRIPAVFRLPHPMKKEIQYAWLRGEFNINNSPEKYYGISLSRVRFTENVYINNQRIGCRDTGEISTMYLPRSYILPQGTLKNGKNEIFIRLGIYGNQHGGFSGNVKFLLKEEFNNLRIWNKLIFKYIPFGIIFLFINFLISHIVFFISNRNDKLYLYGFFLSICFIGLQLCIFFPYKPLNYIAVISAQFALLTFIEMCFLLIIQSIYKIYLPENRFIIPFFFIAGAVTFFSGGLLFNLYNTAYLQIVSFIIYNFYYIYLIKRLYSLNPDKNKLSMAIILVISTRIIEIFEYVFLLTGNIYSGCLTIYFSPVFYFIFLKFYINERIGREIELNNLYEKLRKTGKNINIPDKDNGKKVTDESEQKLMLIINFIKENYTEDISREGLAAAVDMSPNYMSSMFKNYTGIKINEYINRLRIDEAVKQLEENTLKIIDIALLVGFESLSTFNRAFKNIMKKTPTEYRHERLS